MKTIHNFCVIFVIIIAALSGFGCSNSSTVVPDDEQATLITEKSASAVEKATSTDEPVIPTVEQVTPTAEPDDIETFWQDFEITNFDEIHAPVDGDENEYLIFGNLPVSPPPETLAPELATFLGRWEGYDYGNSMTNEIIKIVIVIQEISDQGGKGVLWAGTNVQYPRDVKEFQFKVVPGAVPSIEATAHWPEYPMLINPTFTFLHNPDIDHLEGELRYSYNGNPVSQRIELTRDQTFYVYKDYEKYLAGKGTNDFEITNFSQVHVPVAGDENEHLIFGNVPISPPPETLAPELATFLGRWEGYDYGTAVAKDIKVVFAIQEISDQGGKGVMWIGTNLQYPADVKEFQFKVVPGDPPAIEWTAQWPEHPDINATLTFLYNPDTDHLEGKLKYPYTDNPASKRIELARDQTFYVYKDYEKYLADKRIYPRTFDNDDMQRFGPGYLLYLPEGYENSPEQSWPLLFFLHGSGDRGNNIQLLAKASPFMMVRENAALPFVIVAPLLKQGTFPIEYMDGVLDEARSTYRIDPKRIYLTGLSLGGEATYRFAIHQPDTFAAVAPLAAWLDASQVSSLERIKHLPVWAIHGIDDIIVPLAAARIPVDNLRDIGGNIQFSVLEDHDHDVWTDTYSDSEFYEWLLEHQKP